MCIVWTGKLHILVPSTCPEYAIAPSAHRQPKSFYKR
jgi:hypothetical protein